MNRNQSSNTNQRNILLKLLLIGLGSIVIGTLGYFAILRWFPAFSLQIAGEVNWNLLEGFVSAISLALLLGGLSFAVTEYISTENTKQEEKTKLSYEIYKAIFDKLTDPEQEAARRWILTNITIKGKDEDIAAWYAKANKKIMTGGTRSALPEGQRAVKMTLNCFDYIGFIANHYWDVDDDSLDWISAPIAKVWRRLGPYVEHVRTLRKTTEYYTSAEYIGERCVNWRKEQDLPDEEIAKETP